MVAQQIALQNRPVGTEYTIEELNLFFFPKEVFTPPGCSDRLEAVFVLTGNVPRS